MAFFNFINEVISAAEEGYDKFVTDNAAEIKAASEGAAAVWSIGSKLASIAADMAVDTAKGAYDSLMAEAPAQAKSDAADNNKALIKELEELRRQNEALRKEKEELYSELCRQEAQEDYDLESWADEQQPEHEVEVYENTPVTNLVSLLGETGETFALMAINYLMGHYAPDTTIPWCKYDPEERCVTILRPEGGFAYIGDDSVEEML